MTGFRELDRMYNQWVLWEAMTALLGLAFACFCVWALYVYVTSRREWFEEDIRIREAERNFNSAKAEQIRLECLALKDRLTKSGIDIDQQEINVGMGYGSIER